MEFRTNRLKAGGFILACMMALPLTNTSAKEGGNETPTSDGHEGFIWQDFLYHQNGSGDTADLLLIAITNDMDRDGGESRHGTSMWCREVLNQRLNACVRQTNDSIGQLALEHLPVGMPTSLTGGRVTSQPERLVLVTCDREYRLLSMTMGIPSDQAMMTMIEDSLECRDLIRLAKGRRRDVVETTAAQAARRVNRFYGQRLQKVMRVLESSDPAFPKPRTNAPVQPKVTANGDGSAGVQAVSVATPRRPETEDSQADMQPRAAEGEPTDDVRADEGGITGKSNDREAGEIEEQEWENPAKDRSWESALEITGLRDEMELIDLDQIQRRLDLIHQVFTSLYRIDAFSRFADSDRRKSDTTFFQRELAVLEQHSSTRDDWCQCVVPVLVGLQMKVGWRPFIEQTWQQHSVRRTDPQEDLLAWLDQYQSSPAVVFEITPFAGQERRWNSRQLAGGRSAGATKQLEDALRKLPSLTINAEELVMLQQSGRVLGLDLYQPNDAMQLILPKGSKRPVVIRQGDSPLRSLAKTRRLAGWQSNAAKKFATEQEKP